MMTAMTDSEVLVGDNRGDLLRFLHTWWREVLAVVGAFLVLGPMLLPGYILTLDMVWVPHMPLVWDPNGYNNAYPLFAVVHYLSYLLPGWVSQKLMLAALFFLLFYIPLKFLPTAPDKGPRTLAALVYALNPFVYARLLAGQWLVLMGYALLPYFFYTLVRFCTKPNRTNVLWLGWSLALLGLFAIHFLYTAIMITALWVFVYATRAWLRDGYSIKPYFTGAHALVVFLALSSFWLVPALMRASPIESHFDAVNFAAFAASGIGGVPVMLNLAVLGGYWGEGSVWSLYFVWPQSQILFWVAAGALGLLVVFGVYEELRRRPTRVNAMLLTALLVASYIAALGVAATPFAGINVWLYAHMPLWSGLRDSQKLAGFMALAYAVFAGFGTAALVHRIPHHTGLRPLALAGFLLLPIFFGMYQWNGYHNQLQPVEYPADWYRMREAIQALPEGGKILVLPWHGYLSLDFAHELVAANPAPSFFAGNDPARFVASKSIEAGELHDIEANPGYRALDQVLSASSSPSHTLVSRLLTDQGIDYVLVVKTPRESVVNRNWTDDFARDLGDGSRSDISFDGTSIVKYEELSLIHIVHVINAR